MIGNRMFRRGFFGLMAMALANSYASTAAVAQPAQATPAPSASTVPSASPAAPFDINNLTPDQQKALQLAIIKTLQNPVGNITVVPLQNNFHYGVGPGREISVQSQHPAGFSDHVEQQLESHLTHDYSDPQPAVGCVADRLRNPYYSAARGRSD